MCNSKMIKSSDFMEVATIDGRPVLQPACNRVTTFDAARPLKKSLRKLPSMAASINKPAYSTTRSSSPRKLSPPASPTAAKAKPVLRRCNSLNSSTEKLVVAPKSTAKTKVPSTVRKSKKFNGVPAAPLPSDELINKKSSNGATLTNFSFWSDMEPGSLAAAQREHASLMYTERKMRIAHYGRSPAKIERKVVPIEVTTTQEEKRCSFITANSDPIYVAYHDEEWGVPVHDDRKLFELLVLTGAQVGSDWATMLKKRDGFREAFAGFEAEEVAKFTEKKMLSISAEYRMDPCKVRGVIDNATRILEVRKEFGSLDSYLWSFMNHKPMVTNYKSCRKIPVKTSKSEAISKDLVSRGFRFVGPIVIHSFMQAAGLTNDHVVSCPRHRHCSAATH